jgi:hypothetical protein
LGLASCSPPLSLRCISLPVPLALPRFCSRGCLYLGSPLDSRCPNQEQDQATTAAYSPLACAIGGHVNSKIPCFRRSNQSPTAWAAVGYCPSSCPFPLHLCFASFRKWLSWSRKMPPFQSSSRANSRSGLGGGLHTQTHQSANQEKAVSRSQASASHSAPPSSSPRQTPLTEPQPRQLIPSHTSTPVRATKYWERRSRFSACILTLNSALVLHILIFKL